MASPVERDVLMAGGTGDKERGIGTKRRLSVRGGARRWLVSALEDYGDPRCPLVTWGYSSHKVFRGSVDASVCS